MLKCLVPELQILEILNFHLYVSSYWYNKFSYERVCVRVCLRIKVRKAAKIRNRYNKVPHLTQDTTWESDKNTIKSLIRFRSSALS